jgi:Uma2 family endonuclease
VTTEPEYLTTRVTWPIPPVDGFTAEDLDRIPDLPPHAELIDGSLIFTGAQTRAHAATVDLINRMLDRLAPSDYLVVRDMTVTLGPRQRPEPDVTVVYAEALVSLSQTDFIAADALLTVEVASKESVIRDRKRKPQLYAEAGIEHFWRVENVDDHAVVYVYQLDPGTGMYVPTGVHNGRLKLDVPFPIEIDLSEIHQLGGY